MKPEGPGLWCLLLEDCPSDCFETVLQALAPADLASCRLVCRTWRREIGLLLQRLQPAAGTQPELVTSTFPHLTRLRLTARRMSSSRSGGTATGPSSSQASGGSGSSALPPLAALGRLTRLRSLHLHGPPAAASPLDCRSLLELAGVLPLDELTADSLDLHHPEALQQLPQLTSLRLEGCVLSSWHDALPALLLPLTRLEHLHFSSPHTQAQPAVAVAGEGAPAAAAPAAAASSAGPAAGQLGGLSQLTSLTSLDLSCWDGASAATCHEVAALPRLSSLSIRRCMGLGSAAPSMCDATLAVLCQLSRQLTSLCLSGHSSISNEGMRCIARLALLQHLELRVGTPGLSGPLQPELTDAGVVALAGLTRLRSLHLGGACGIGEAGCAAIAASLPSLTSLQLTDCASLSDTALFRLAPLAPALRQLALSGCSSITDIGLAVVLRGATRLSRLDLSGCHRHITGVGLAACGIPHYLRRLTHLNLAGCEAITDLELEALLPSASSLQRLDLRDCRVTDRACALLAAFAPNLRWLSLEHCPRVSNAGLHCLAGTLRHLNELHLFGSGVGPEAVTQLHSNPPRGRRLRTGMRKHCWWLPAPAPQLPVAATGADGPEAA